MELSGEGLNTKYKFERERRETAQKPRKILGKSVFC
jgi:hypothetical protein